MVDLDRFTRYSDLPKLLPFLFYVMYKVELGNEFWNLLVLSLPVMNLLKFSMFRKEYYIFYGFMTTFDRCLEIHKLYFGAKILLLCFLFSDRYKFYHCLKDLSEVLKTWYDGKRQAYFYNSTPIPNTIFSPIIQSNEDSFEQVRAYESHNGSPTEGTIELKKLPANDSCFNKTLPVVNLSSDTVDSFLSMNIPSKNSTSRRQFQQNLFDTDYLISLTNFIDGGEYCPKIDEFNGTRFRFSDTILGCLVAFADANGFTGKQIAQFLESKYYDSMDKRNLRKGFVLYGYIQKHMPIDTSFIITGIRIGASNGNDSCRGEREIVSEFDIPDKVQYRNSASTKPQGTGQNGKANPNGNKLSLVQRVFGRKFNVSVEAFISQFYFINVVCDEIQPEFSKLFFDPEGPQRPYAAHVRAEKSKMKAKGELTKVFHLKPS